MTDIKPQGRARRARTTRRGVLLGDRLARVVITIVGVGTIAAVASLCVFLVWVVAPLFVAPQVQGEHAVSTSQTSVPGGLLAVGTDENLSLGWSLSTDGEFASFDLRDGSTLAVTRPFDAAPAAFSITAAEGDLSLGFQDGTLRRAHIGFHTTFLDGESLPSELLELRAGEARRQGAGIAERTPGGQVRLRELAPTIEEPFAVTDGVGLRLVDAAGTATTPVLASLDQGGLFAITQVLQRTNLLTGATRTTLVRGALQLEFQDGTPPRWLALSGLGDNAFLVWEDGTLWRIDTADSQALRVVEKLDVTPDDDARVSALGFLIGRTTLVIGDSAGRTGAWFRTKPADAGSLDGSTLVLAAQLPGPAASVSALAASSRARLLAVGYADGSARLFHVTSGRELFTLQLPAPTQAVAALALSPRDDALLVAGERSMALWHIDVGHPETSLGAVFAPVWYEGFEHPEHTWQSTGGTDDFEPKYGMLPLVFGTLKATGYSLIFAVPLALLAAIYTSEFMQPRHKARVKPVIEMMASLPSVVLGFLAALVIAPLVETRVPALLASIYLLPVSVVLGGHLWGVLPASLGARLERVRPVFVGLFMLCALGAGSALGPTLERALFAGDMRTWLSGSIGNGRGGWVLLGLPAVALAVAWLRVRLVDARLVNWSAARPGGRFALVDLAAFLVSALLTALLTWSLAVALDSAGLDPRGGVLGTYVQRNALVVGFAMGFAIVPIIYTIAEDSLAAVPDHLRAASLGAGATPWQTAVRVVVPAAMSGLFSAVMVGLGRAVGETMIVLMAAGNTPIMDWNIFNGFRTLSANIAVEMPEAVQGSTHYRMLFLAALVLFALTFALNTLAEIVRLRYRRRKVAL